MARASVAGRSRVRRWGWVAWALLIVASLTVIVAAIVWQHFPPPKDFERFAAAFGAIAGAVFSAFAFAGLIVTALMQREELSLQREELRETRGVLERTAEVQAESLAAFQEQAAIARLTARLNAETGLLNHYERRLDGYKQDPQERTEAEQITWDAVVRASQSCEMQIQRISQDLEQRRD